MLQLSKRTVSIHPKQRRYYSYIHEKFIPRRHHLRSFHRTRTCANLPVPSKNKQLVAMLVVGFSCIQPLFPFRSAASPTSHRLRLPTHPAYFMNGLTSKFFPFPTKSPSE